jgi:tRNA pseudouridine55 synthase
LPVCFGEATKIAGLLLGNAKAYETTAQLGSTTDTDDADGQPLRQRPVPALGEATILVALQAFIGRIRQRPPIYSALKQGGEPLYAKARRGEVVDVPERDAEVHAIELLAFNGDSISLRITCGSGTYIRSIVRDLGEALGCGAHVLTLRRLWVAPFTEPHMATLEALQALALSRGEATLDALLLPVEAGLAGWPQVTLDAAQAAALGKGQPVPLAVGGDGQDVNVVDGTGRSLGLARLDSDGTLRAKRLFRWICQG